MPFINLVGGGVGRFPVPTTEYCTITLSRATFGMYQVYASYNGTIHDYDTSFKVPKNTGILIGVCKLIFGDKTYLSGSSPVDIKINGVSLANGNSSLQIPVAYTVIGDTNIEIGSSFDEGFSS